MIPEILRRQYLRFSASLYRKYVLIIGLLVVGALLFSGGLDIFFTYQDKLNSLSDLEREEAFLAASNIDFFFGDSERRLQQIAKVEYPNNESGIAARERDYLELVNQMSAITGLGYWNSAGDGWFVTAQPGREDFTTDSPLSIEQLIDGAKTNGTFYGPSYFDENAVQHLTIGIADPGIGEGVLIAQVDLNIVQAIISQMSFHFSHSAYVVDSRGFIVAHPNQELVTQQTNVLHLSQVQSAIEDAPGFNPISRNETAVDIGTSLDGRAVLATSYPCRQFWLECNRRTSPGRGFGSASSPNNTQRLTIGGRFYFGGPD